MEVSSTISPTDPVAKPPRRVLLASPRGFCAGVERAIETVERALDEFGPPVYVRRAIVHNTGVVKELEQRGAIFVAELDEVPQGATAILSAHGSARSVKIEGKRRNLRLIDAICPLVAKVHAEVEAWHCDGRHVLMVGHQGHPEIVGTTGQLPAGALSVIASPEDIDRLDLDPGSPVAVAIQTTFAAREAEAMVAAINARFSDVVMPRASDICYATTNRQAAIQGIAGQADLVLVVGDGMSSNARRLVEVASASGCPAAYLVDGAEALPWDAVAGSGTIGVTAAASTPESAVLGVCDALRQAGYRIEEVGGVKERVRFRPVFFETSDRASARAKPQHRAPTLPHQFVEGRTAS